MQANIQHIVYRAHALDKDEVIGRILQAEGRGKTVIFMRTKRAAAKLQEELTDRGFAAASVHGDLNQDQRERAMAAFKAGKKEILIATDVAARGIDVDDVTHVINHTVPDDDKTYLHRVGRTGRAGRNGVAVTFVDWEDMHKWALINSALEFGTPEPRETYSSSPHLFEELNIPEGTKGRLKATPVKDGPPRGQGRGSGRSGTAGRSGGSGNSEGAAGRNRARRRTRSNAPQNRERGTAENSSQGEPNQATAESAAGETGAVPARRRRRRRRTSSGAANKSTSGGGSDASAPAQKSD